VQEATEYHKHTNDHIGSSAFINYN